MVIDTGLRLFPIEETGGANLQYIQEDEKTSQKIKKTIRKINSKEDKEDGQEE